MPTAKKESQIEEIKDRLSRCTIAVATGYQGMSAANMTDLRARLREQGIEYRVIKNTLTLRAASELGKDGVGDVLRGPTALAFGYGDVVAVAKGINGYITTTRMPLVIHGAVMDGDILTAAQVINLASLPSKDELIARLLAQMQAPIVGLVNVLSAPLRGLVTVLQRAAEQGVGPTAVAEPEAKAVAEADVETEAVAETNVEAVAEAETEAVAEAEAEAVAEADTETEAVAEVEVEAVAEADTETEAVAEVEVEAVAEADTETEAVAEPETETEESP
jgi:large subunit ribosomal protein L10